MQLMPCIIEEPLLSKSKKTPVRKSAVHGQTSRRSRPISARNGAVALKADRQHSRDEPAPAEKQIVVEDDFELNDELAPDDANPINADEAPEHVAEDVDLDSGLEGHIDDPVRMYLMQMGEIPLLSRPEEIAAAKEIERTRTHFRHSMLASGVSSKPATARSAGTSNPLR